MSDDEPGLWRSWRERRDERAFETLVRPHLSFATAFARRLGCGPDDADEVVQRSLVRLARENRERPAKVGVRAWLGRDVLQEARMLARSERRRARHEAAALPRRLPGTEAVDARDEVEAALAALDEDARRAVELRFLHDLEYREVAFVLGRSPLACRLLVHRAIRRLRRRFGSSAPLLVAALPRMGEVTATRATESIALATSYGSAGSSTATIAGGLVMATACKVGGAAAGIALLAWLGWSVLGPTAERSGGTPPVATAPAATPGLAARPPLLRPASPSPEEPATRAATDLEGAPASVPLDAPIPAGKGSVAGTIRFTDGKPFEHARVGLWGSPAVVAETDDEGRYHIHGDWVGARELTLFGPNESSLGLGALARMEAGVLVGIDVTIDRGYALQAHVVDAVTGAPVAGASVTLRRPGAHSSNVMQAGFGFGKTDLDGRFRLDFVPAAAYFLSVQAAGYRTFAWTGEVRSSPEPLEVRLTTATPLVLQYVGAPPAAVGTKVSWMLQKANDPFCQAGAGIVAENGEARGDAPPPGNYHLTVFEGGVLPRFEQDVTVREGDPLTVVVRVAASGAVRGTLRGADGGPISNTRIRIADASPATTDAEGRFDVPRVAQGRQTVWILFDDGMIRVGSVEVGDGTANADLRLPVVGEVSAMIPGVAVVAIFPLGSPDRGSQVAEARPDANGRIHVPFLAPGSYRLIAFGGSLAENEERTIEILPGQALDLGEIGLRRFPAVPVAVTLPQGMTRPPMLFATIARPISSAPTGGSAFMPGRIEFDGEGKGWLKGLPAGAFLVRVSLPGVNPLSVEVELEIRDGITTPIPIELRAR